jgi:hypothetical protein
MVASAHEQFPNNRKRLAFASLPQLWMLLRPAERAQLTYLCATGGHVPQRINFDGSAIFLVA